MTVQKYTIICSDDPYCHSRRERARRSRERPHSELKIKNGTGHRARVSRATVLIGVSGQNYAATRGRLVRSDIYGYKRTLAASFYASRDKSQNVDI